MTDKLKLEGVFSKGYGTIPKLVMQDTEITPEAKSIYAYLCSYAGAGDTAFPSVELMMHHLAMGDKRFYKHRKLLTDRGYITIERQRLENGFSKNIYTLCNAVYSQNDYLRNDSLQNDQLQNDHLQNNGTNNNSFNNNSINNNKVNNNDDEDLINSKKQENQIPKDVYNFYQDNFGEVSVYIIKELMHWINILNSELVLEAMKRSKDYEKEFGYAKKIMQNWKQLNFQTIKDVKEEDEVFAKRKKSSYSKQGNVQKETLPEWAREDYEPPEEVSTKSEEINDRLSRLREYKKERGIIQ